MMPVLVSPAPDPTENPAMYAGCRQVLIEDEAQSISFPAVVLYPTETVSEATAFGPYTIDVSPDAPIAAGPFPLVVISHGNGGSHLLYHTIATHLARNGYIVAMPEHYGNNRNNNDLECTHENLVNRPRHVRLTIDAVAAFPMFAASLQQNNIAVVGHSIGGYTALAVAGGTPWSETGQRVEVETDSRVRALVLLAPATAWYLPPEALRHVNVPILILIAEHDTFTPGWHADIVRNGVPNRDQVSCRVVENAGHFSFLSPFPSPMNSPSFRPSTDPAGFDRKKFHMLLPGEVCRFLDHNLKNT